MTDDSLVYRQIHPSFVQAGFPTSQAFRPTHKDESNLSVYDGDQITSDDAFRHYVEALGYSSVGVMGLTVSECKSESLQVHLDPLPFPQHAIIDFTGLNDNACRKTSKKLQGMAVKRGWLYRAS